MRHYEHGTLAWFTEVYLTKYDISLSYRGIIIFCYAQAIANCGAFAKSEHAFYIEYLKSDLATFNEMVTSVYIYRGFRDQTRQGLLKHSPLFHDDFFKWKHFPRYWPFVGGTHRSLVNSPHKDQWRGALMCSLFCAWINNWANNGVTGDLRRHRAHFDVTVMLFSIFKMIKVLVLVFKITLMFYRYQRCIASANFNLFL